MNLLIPKCASSPKPFRVEHKLVGAESTKLSMSDGVTLTGSDVLKAKKNHTQCVCLLVQMYVCERETERERERERSHNNTELYKILYNTFIQGRRHLKMCYTKYYIIQTYKAEDI